MVVLAMGVGVVVLVFCEPERDWQDQSTRTGRRSSDGDDVSGGSDGCDGDIHSRNG